MNNQKILFLVISAILITTALPTIAYNICNKSNTPILVLVFESENKGKASLQGMGWQGSCWDFATGQTIPCKVFPPKSNIWLIPQPQQDVFLKPKQYVALHKIASQDVCDRYNWRDIQRKYENVERNYERMENRKLYFMVFEKFKKKSSQKIHFLASGYHPIQSTINFSGSADAGWKLESQP